MSMFEQTGSHKSKLLDRFSPRAVARSVEATLQDRAARMAADLNVEFPRAVQRATEIVQQAAAEDKQEVPEQTRAMIEAAAGVEFIEGPCLSSIVVAGEIGVEVRLKDADTPVGPASLVAGTFEYGSDASAIPTIPTFRNAADKEVMAAGRTAEEVSKKLL
jgi:hypothetical protein